MDADPLRSRHRRLTAGAGLSLGVAFGLSPQALADVDVVTVTTAADPGDANCNTNGCTLREAITVADDADTDPDQILFQSGLTGTVTLTANHLPTINEPLEILGPGPGILAVSGNQASRIFSVQDATGPVTVSGLTVTSGNSGGNVGGAMLVDNSALTVRSSAVVNNDSGDGGAGIWADGGSLTVRNSTISGNDAVGVMSYGGGIASYAPNTLLVQHSTISDNDAERGGGLYAQGSATIESSTIADNGAHFGGGLYEAPGAPVPTLTNTIVADNGVTGVGAQGPDLLNVFNASFTLVEQTSGANVMQTVAGSNITDDVTDGLNDVDPQLGALGPNGGPTQTHALPMTSRAVDKGSSAGPADQRGQPRPFDVPSIANSLAVGANGADMGAFELQVPQAAPPTSLLPSPSTPAPVKKKKCKKKRKRRSAAAAKKRCKKKR